MSGRGLGEDGVDGVANAEWAADVLHGVQCWLYDTARQAQEDELGMRKHDNNNNK